MDLISTMGFIAAILTTSSFLPQVIKILKTKSTKDISLPSYVVLGTGVFLWMIYGMALNQLPIILANGITLTLVISVILLKSKHG